MRFKRLKYVNNLTYKGNFIFDFGKFFVNFFETFHLIDEILNIGSSVL